MDIEQMRIELKESGIKQAMNMKEETIVKKYSELKEDKPKTDKPKVAPLYEVAVEDKDKVFFDSIGLKCEWLDSIANQYGFNRFAYIHKFRAFRCYQGNNQLDWISVNDLSLLNVRKEITQIVMKHQPNNKDKKIINLPWRE